MAQSPTAEIHHFIGKDITYFHTLFWPAMLKTAGFNLPTKVHIHGFLTVDGEKMSKTQGHVRAAPRRTSSISTRRTCGTYYASKLTPRLDDLDLEPRRVRRQGELATWWARSSTWPAARPGSSQETGLAATYPDDGGLFAQAAAEGTTIAEAYEACDYNRPCGRSWPWPTGPTSTSTTGRRGRCGKIRPRPPSCSRSAPWR